MMSVKQYVSKSSISVGESKSRDETGIHQYAQILQEKGFVVIPREVVGFHESEIEDLYNAQLQQARKQFGDDWFDAGVEWTKSSKKRWGKSGTAGKVNAFAEQYKLFIDQRVNRLFDYMFEALRIQRDSDTNLIKILGSRLSLNNAWRTSRKQAGLTPHVDENPWSNQSPNERYDYEFWKSKVNSDIEHARLKLRPRERYKPIASFLALTDCVGGCDGGGMGCSTCRDAFSYYQKSHNHGRNKYQDDSTRSLKQVKKYYKQEEIDPTKPLPKTIMAPDTYKEYQKKDKEIWRKMVYPEYKKGDIVMWLSETFHAGPKNNTSEAVQSRMYIGMLPDCVLNRQFVQRQWNKLDDANRTFIINNFTREQRRRFGENADTEE